MQYLSCSENSHAHVASSSASQTPASHTLFWKVREKLQHCNGNVGAGRNTGERKRVNAYRAPWQNRASKNIFCPHTSLNILAMEAWEIWRLLDHDCGEWHCHRHRTCWQQKLSILWYILACYMQIFLGRKHAVETDIPQFSKDIYLSSFELFAWQACLCS